MKALGSLRPLSMVIVSSLVACSAADETTKTPPPPACPTAVADAGAPVATPLPPIRPDLAGDEGMWLLAPTSMFPVDRVKEKYGFTVTPAFLDHARLAAARLARGCSGSFVSPNGLVMTNHHCAAECLQQISSKEHDYLSAGFDAKTDKDEPKCPGAEIDQLVEVTDVTARMNQATQGQSEMAYFAAQRAAKNQIEKECATSPEVRCDVVTLYHGGLYHLYKYKRFQDVRLVFAPEQDIAFFGGDPDNFNFPRFDLDVSFLRVYEHDKPAKMEHFFKWSAHGVKANDLTFVVGNPGRTSREFTKSQLEYDRDVRLPETLMYASETRGALTEFRELGKEQAREAKESLLRVENSFKAYKGEFEALAGTELFQQKVAAEDALRARVDADPKLHAELGGAWEAIANAEKTRKDLHLDYNVLERRWGFGGDLFEHARELVRYASESVKPNNERLREYSDSQLPEMKQEITSAAPIYDDFEIFELTRSLTKMRELLGADALIVKKVLGKKSPKELATDTVKGSKLKDPKVRKALLDGGKDAIDASTDPMIQLARLVDPEARAARKAMEDQVDSVVQKNGELIAKAKFTILGTATYPDATFTLRIAFGHVEGWLENGVQVQPFTTIGGAFDRATGSEPFALPKSWLEAKGKLDLATPFNMSLTNDVVGGNSGSPVINKDGEIVGLIFDGNIESLGGEYGYNPKNNRSVAVTSQALVEALDKIYGAKRVLAELQR